MSYYPNKNKQATLSLIYLFVFYICEYEVNGENVSDILKRTLPAYTVATEYEILDVSSPCRNELNAFREAVDTRKLWGLKMLDASGEPKAGFLYGNNFWLGVKSQCFDIDNQSPFQITLPVVNNNNSIGHSIDEEIPPFRVNYFAAHFRHNSTLQYRLRIKPNEDVITLGLCLPDSCTTTELAMILEKIFQERTLMISDLYRADYKIFNIVNFKNSYNYYANWKVVTAGIIFFITTVLLILGTIYDIVVHQKRLKIEKPLKKKPAETNALDGINSTKLMEIQKDDITISYQQKTSFFHQILLCFSIYTNTKTIFDANTELGSIKSLYGLKVIISMWIIMAHVNYYASDYIDNPLYKIKMMVQAVPSKILLTNGNITVDTFLFLSGFLVAYNFYKQESKKKNQGIQPAKFSCGQLGNAIFKRWARLTPVYLIVLGILLIYSIFYEENSQFLSNEHFKNNCDNYWWRNLLYINNLFPFDDMCATWSWYLPNDMQYFIIAKILTVCSVRYFYTSTAVWLGLMMFSTGYNGYLSHNLNYTHTLEMMWKTRNDLYISPFTRIQPYLIGVAAAYLLVRINHKINIKTSTIWILWSLGTVLLFAINFIMLDRQVSAYTIAIYMALNKIVWGLSIGWIVIACATGHGGLIDRVLSMKIFIVLGKLTYCAYLINPIVIKSLYINADVTLHTDSMILLSMRFGTLIMTYTGAYLLYIFFEIPYALLLEVLTSKQSSKKNH